MKDLLELYKNYLLSIQYQKEFGDKYGDTQELINMYEEELKLKELSNERRISNRGRIRRGIQRDRKIK